MDNTCQINPCCKCGNCGNQANLIGVSEKRENKYHCPDCYKITYIKEDKSN